MKTRTKKVYYCDYCKKHMFRESAMARHERICTANIYRQCGMCDKIGEWCDVPAILKDLKQRRYTINKCGGIESIDKPITVIEIRKLTNGCPACMLTIARALNGKIGYLDEWDYQKEVSNFWKKYNKEVYEDNLYRYQG